MSNEQPSPARIDYRGADLRGNNMAGMNLDYADMRGADMREVNFTRSSLRYADLRGARVQGANFQYAVLYGAKMQGVEAHQADFRNSDTRQVNWSGAYVDGAMMTPPQRQSPGEIGDGKRQPPETFWDERLEEERKGTQDANAGNGQEGQAGDGPVPAEQRGKGRGR